MELLRERSERRAWLVAKASLAIATLSVAAVVAHGQLHQLVPMVFTVDKTTGEVTRQTVLDVETVRLDEAEDKHNLQRYVTARESYFWRFLKRDYDTVARMSTTETFRGYAAQFEGSERLDEKWKNTQEHEARVVSVRLAGPAPGGEAREAVVTFERTSTYFDRSRPSLNTRWQATVQYQYQPRMAMKELDRLDNPKGFLVTGYRKDQDIVAVSSGSTP